MEAGARKRYHNKKGKEAEMVAFKRTLARFIDYLLWSMAMVLILGGKTGDGVFYRSWQFYASFWVYAAVEAALVSVFKTTAGKAMLGIYVCAADGGRLRFSDSLKRSLTVFAGGTGCLLSYASLALPLYAVYGMLRRRPMFWDEIARDRVEVVPMTRLTKGVFALFVLFMLTGWALTARVLYLSRTPDFDEIEEQTLAVYYEDVRPHMIRALSEESPLSPDAAVWTLAELERVQKKLQDQSEYLAAAKADFERRIDKIPVPAIRAARREKAEEVFTRADRTVFLQSMIVSLFENTLGVFTTARSYTVSDGVPVFDDPEINARYEKYMKTLYLFLAKDMP